MVGKNIESIDISMDTIFNPKRQKEKRQYLRRNATLPEKIIWHLLRKKQLLGYKFRRQHGIGYFIVDFYSPRLRLAIEIDGPSHESPEEREHDKNRQEIIEQCGICFLRFSGVAMPSAQ